MLTMDRAGNRYMCQRITESLASLAKELGVSIEAGGGQIGENLTVKVEIKNGGAVAEQATRREIEMYGRAYGLVADDYGTEFTFNGKRWRFTGITPTRPKYPLNATLGSTGTSYKLPATAAAAIAQERQRRAHLAGLAATATARDATLGARGAMF